MLRVQSASLVLTTTPPEELAAGLTSLLGPLRLVGVPAKEIGVHTIAQRCNGQGSGSDSGSRSGIYYDCLRSRGLLRCRRVLTEMRMRSELVAKPSQRLTMVPDPLVMAAMLWAPGADLLH